MKLLPNAVTSRFGRQLLHVQKASPKLMFAAGVAGVVTSTVLACRSTLKLSDVLLEAEKTATEAGMLFNKPDNTVYTEKAYKKDLAILKGKTVVNVAKLYALPIGIGAVSICLLTGSHVVLNRRNASLTAAYAGAEKAFQEYRERVRDQFGEDQDRKFRYGFEEYDEVVAKKDGGTKTVKKERVGCEMQPSQYARFFDATCENWTGTPEYNRIFLNAQQQYANDKLRAQGHMFLNEVYDALGLPRSGEGAVVGWVWGKGGDDYIDFGVFDDKTGTGAARDFVNGREGSILLDFNVDGVIYDKI